MNVDAVFRMPFGSRLCIAAGPAAVCFPEPDRLLPTAVVCRAFTAPGRGHLSASFFIRSGLLSCRISLCGEPVRSSTAVRVRLSARLSAFLRSGFNCRPGDPLFSGPDSAAGPAVCIPHTAVCPVVFSFGPEAIACLIVCSSAVRLQLPVRCSALLWPGSTVCPIVRSSAARRKPTPLCLRPYSATSCFERLRVLIVR